MGRFSEVVAFRSNCIYRRILTLCAVGRSGDPPDTARKVWCSAFVEWNDPAGELKTIPCDGGVQVSCVWAALWSVWPHRMASLGRSSPSTSTLTFRCVTNLCRASFKPCLTSLCKHDCNDLELTFKFRHLFPPVISVQVACTLQTRQDEDKRKAISMC